VDYITYRRIHNILRPCVFLCVCVCVCVYIFMCACVRARARVQIYVCSERIAARERQLLRPFCSTCTLIGLLQAFS
jgi:hypothetical protein